MERPHSKGCGNEMTEEKIKNRHVKGIICPHCGTVNPNDQQFCLNCGQKLPKATVEPTLRIRHPKKKRRQIIIVTILALLIISGLAAYGIKKHNDANNMGMTYYKWTYLNKNKHPVRTDYYVSYAPSWKSSGYVYMLTYPNKKLAVKATPQSFMRIYHRQSSRRIKFRTSDHKEGRTGTFTFSDHRVVKYTEKGFKASDSHNPQVKYWRASGEKLKK